MYDRRMAGAKNLHAQLPPDELGGLLDYLFA
jgi:hypothetical protein